MDDSLKKKSNEQYVKSTKALKETYIGLHFTMQINQTILFPFV